jgi:hypothetical protein
MKSPGGRGSVPARSPAARTEPRPPDSFKKRGALRRPTIKTPQSTPRIFAASAITWFFGVKGNPAHQTAQPTTNRDYTRSPGEGKTTEATEATKRIKGNRPPSGHDAKGLNWAESFQDLRENATAPLSSPGATGVPVIAVSDLWALADWPGRRRSPQGDEPCSTDLTDQSPHTRATHPGRCSPRISGGCSSTPSADYSSGGCPPPPSLCRRTD